MPIMFHNGAILFTPDGLIAMDPSCCCCVETSPNYFFVEISDAGYVDLSEAVPPLINGSTLYYHGRVRDTVLEPYGSRYWTHLWLIELCLPVVDHGSALADYEELLDEWAQGVAPGLGANLGLSGGDNSDYYVTSMKAEKLNTPDNPQQLVEDLYGPNLPPPGCPPCD